MGGRGAAHRHQVSGLSVVLAMAVACAGVGLLGAGEPVQYSVEGRRSGYIYLLPENQRLQDDEFANPGLLWVERLSCGTPTGLPVRRVPRVMVRRWRACGACARDIHTLTRSAASSSTWSNKSTAAARHTCRPQPTHTSPPPCWRSRPS